MRPKELTDLLKVQIEHGSNPDEEFGSLFIYGPPGIGKSRIVEDVANELGVGCVDFRLLLRDPSDLRGIPVPGHNGDGKPAANWLPPAELPTNGQGFLFFDDFVTAPPLVQASAYQLTIRPHKLGEYQLPEGWVIVGAGNRPQDLTLAHPMPPALRTRFATIVELEVNHDDWVEWAVTHNIRPEIIGLLSKFRPELLFQYDPRKFELTGFPCPRAWENASHNMDMLPSELWFEGVRGAVGEGAAIELRAYMEIWSQLPDLDAIIEGKDDTIPHGVDLIYACCVGLVSKADKQAHYNRLLDYALKLEREYSIFLVKLLYHKSREQVTKSDKWGEFARILVNEEKILE
ncbi:MAG: MoxR family ATPase [Dehalococcoidia bacterium]|nr:MoxR family ATPase [Dehalococcoidia bacterium]